MYKFFINDKPLIITEEANIPERFGNLPVESYAGPQSLMSLVRKIEELNTPGMVLTASDSAGVFNELKTHFTTIHAGGGIVLNDDKQLLLMKRLGKWDLPKGKIDPGETAEEGALREVEEECGINLLRIKNFFDNSYHTYKLQGHRFLKITHWYTMNTGFKGELVPQEEENITEVKWVNFEELDLDSLDTYESIREILKQYKGA